MDWLMVDILLSKIGLVSESRSTASGYTSPEFLQHSIVLPPEGYAIAHTSLSSY